MSLFYRRSVQKILDSSSLLLSADQAVLFVEKLNKHNVQSLHAQWELVLLSAFSQMGTVVHEPVLNGSCPDLLWSCNSTNEEIVMDVRTVSDSGLEDENPREFYRQELRRRVALRGFNPNNFWDQPQGRLVGEANNRKMVLQYPKISECNRLFGSEFESFLSDIRLQSPVQHRHRFVGEGFDVTIGFQAGLNGYGGGNPSYTVYYSLTKNPIYRALQEKAAQLRRTKFEGPLGILLADGGCRALSGNWPRTAGEVYSDEQVISRFFQNTQSISFVITIYVETPTRAFGGFGPPTIRGKLVKNPRCRYPISEDVEMALTLLPSKLPKPTQDAWNAANKLKRGEGGYSDSLYTSTGATLDLMEEEFRVSSRALLDFLAGKISREKFAEMHSGSMSNGDCFKALLRRGYGICDVRFVAHADEDDDHILIKFMPDVAMAPFQIPGGKFKGPDAV